MLNPTAASVSSTVPPILTAAQASVYLQVPVSTLAVWRSTNRVHLPYVKLGGLVRYRRCDLEAFIDGRLVNGGRHSDTPSSPYPAPGRQRLKSR